MYIMKCIYLWLCLHQIISPTSSMDEVKDDEVAVSFMKQRGGLFMFPEERERVIIDQLQIEKKLETPTLKRRGPYQFCQEN